MGEQSSPPTRKGNVSAGEFYFLFYCMAAWSLYQIFSLFPSGENLFSPLFTSSVALLIEDIKKIAGEAGSW